MRHGGDTAVWRTYGYDARRKLVDLNDLYDSGENRDFTYDPNGRLLTAAGPWGSGSFSYDAEGNLRGQTLGPRAISVAYDANNRAASANDNGVVKNYAYVDGRGNATTVGANTFTYDFANQPVSVSGGVGGTYAYDTNLKRVKSVVGGVTTYSIYSRVSGGIILSDDVTNNVVTEYASVGQASVRLKNGVREFTHSDHLGSPIAATDNAGVVQWRESYDPFGEARLKTAANDNQTGFTGHIDDRATGLTYMQARYYDPVIGRFLSTDPVGYADQLNLYAYVGNDPVNMVDPDGQIRRDANGKIKYNKTGTARLGAGDKHTIASTGYVRADDGTRIEAYKNSKGGDDGFTSNCHGRTFADGEYWINDDQVDALLSGDGYKQVGEDGPRAGDAVIYRDANGDVKHSMTVQTVDSKTGEVTVTGDYGAQSETYTHPADQPKIDSIKPENGGQIEYYRKEDQ